MVIASLPARYRMLAATRRYLPVHVPLVKHVAAAAGDEVCAIRSDIFVNGTRVAVRRSPMPRAARCRGGRGACDCAAVRYSC